MGLDQQAQGDFGFLATRTARAGALQWGVYVSSPRQQLCFYYLLKDGQAGSICASHVNDGGFHDVLVVVDGPNARILLDGAILLQTALPSVLAPGAFSDTVHLGCQVDRLFFSGRLMAAELHFHPLSSFQGPRPVVR